MLKSKIVTLENYTSSNQPHEVVSQVLHEPFERERCMTNLIEYCITESTFSSIPERVTHDESKIMEILRSLGDSITSFPKCIRLGKTLLMLLSL